MTELTAAIASFCAESSMATVDQGAIDHAVRALDRTLSISSTMVRDPLIARIDATLGAATGPVLIGGVGPSRRYVPSTAALTIACAAALGEHSHSRAEQVPGVVVASAFVAAQLRDCSGERLIVAIALGCELAERTRRALGDAHVARGWDPLGSAGRIGATCAASYALGSDAAQSHAALGFASTMAAGMRVAGGELLALGAGKAAADALEAAVLASEGLIGPPEPIAGRRGLFALTAPGGFAAEIVEDLGEHWHGFALLEPLSIDGVASLVAAESHCASVVDAFRECVERELPGRSLP